MWFGGFCFYVSIVVPIATDVLGSSFDQGLITRRVTQVLNWFGLCAGAMMLVHSCFGLKSGRSKATVVQLVSVVLMLIMQLVLFWLHPQIDAYVDVEIRDIAGDYDQFYFLHRLYLWASTVQWFASWLWLICFVVENGKTSGMSQP